MWIAGAAVVRFLAAFTVVLIGFHVSAMFGTHEASFYGGLITAGLAQLAAAAITEDRHHV